MAICFVADRFCGNFVASSMMVPGRGSDGDHESAGCLVLLDGGYVDGTGFGLLEKWLIRTRLEDTHKHRPSALTLREPSGR